MLSLYFNCRLTEKRLTPDRIDSGYFYPVTYPQRVDTESLSQYAVLLKTIDSYAVFQYETIIFNIAIDYIDRNIENEIDCRVRENYSANKIVLKFTRPSTINEWMDDTEEALTLIDKNSPVLVVMNHDHPFIDYTPSIFTDLVEKVFPETENNLGKALYYSHAPEVISWAINGRTGTNFVRQCWGGYKSEKVNHWIDSICVMTLETLSDIWSKAKYEGSYIGRVDWPDVQYSQLALITYAFPREFFKHFDGYGHVTGMKLISDISSMKSTMLSFPYDSDTKGVVGFYYQRWLDCFSLSIRDTLRNQAYSVGSQKKIFVSAIEDSLDLFRVGYLEEDAKIGMIDKAQINIIECALRSNIYYFGNSIYDVIKTDILLMEGSVTDKIKRFLPYKLLIGLRLFKRGIKVFTKMRHKVENKVKL